MKESEKNIDSPLYLPSVISVPDASHLMKVETTFPSLQKDESLVGSQRCSFKLYHSDYVVVQNSVKFDKSFCSVMEYAAMQRKYNKN